MPSLRTGDTPNPVRYNRKTQNPGMKGPTTDQLHRGPAPDECDIHGRPTSTGPDRAVPIRPAAQRTYAAWHPHQHPGADPFHHAVLILRWFLDATRITQLASDNTISRSTATTIFTRASRLAAQAPKLESALLAAKTAGHGHVSIDGTLIETTAAACPARPWEWICGVGKTRNHGGNIQVIHTRRPERLPLWTSDVRPGREHDTSALRAAYRRFCRADHWTGDNLPVLGDLGYEGEADTITVAVKKPQGGELTESRRTRNKAHNGKRAVGERGNSLLKTKFKALRNVSFVPGRSATSSLRAGFLAYRSRPHDMITQSNKPLRGRAPVYGCRRSLAPRLLGALAFGLPDRRLEGRDDIPRLRPEFAGPLPCLWVYLSARRVARC